MSAAEVIVDDVLLPYQQELIRCTAANQVTVVEKSRRIGITWGAGADAVLMAGADRKDGGDDVLYMGYEKDMTREFIDVCAMWSKSFGRACSEVEEFLFDDGEDNAIKAFRIDYGSGFKIVALCSRPRALRGKQGYVILDEAAFHDDLLEVIKAALALLIWGGRLLIMSTHDGAENAFNELVQDIRENRLPYKLLKITFQDALDQGLYKRICLTKGQEWSQAKQDAWEAEIRSRFPGDSAAEELDCIPRNSGGKYLSRVLLMARAEDCPVLNWTQKDAFVDAPDEVRSAECLEWCEENLGPVLAALRGENRHYLGEDFGRTGDLTVFWISELGAGLKLSCKLLVELRNIPFREQETLLMYIGDKLPRFSGAAFDARGNGQPLAERARQRWGAHLVQQVMLTAPWYAEQWPLYKAALEDDKASVPANSDIIDDFRTVEMVKGVPRVVERTSTKDGQRHGDAAIAGLLCFFASQQIDVGEVEASSAAPSESLGAFSDSFTGGNPEEIYNT